MEKEFISFLDKGYMQKVIIITKKILKSNTGDSSNKSGTNTGLLSSTPYSKGRIKGKNNQSSSKRGNCLYHG